MIIGFADKHTQELFCTGQSKRFPASMTARAVRKLDMLSAACSVDDLRVPPSNRLHALQEDRFGQYSISIYDQWRICFRFKGEDAYDVEICDYH